MNPIIPFWFKQRQCKAEPAGSANVLKLTGPNLGEAYVHVECNNGRWIAGLRLTANGPDVAVCDEGCPTEKQAWEAAFELYRAHLII